MSQLTVFTAANQLFEVASSATRAEGQDFNLRGVTLPHWPVKDTALAACLATLGIPFRDPVPYSDDVATDQKGHELSRSTLWWLGDASAGDAETAHRTEELLGAWIHRERFEKEFPLHPLVAMRAAIEARNWWVQVIQAWREGRAILPTEAPAGQATFSIDKINGAAVLKACGYAPLAFNRDGFFFPRVKDQVPAQKVLLAAALNAGQTPPQWMSRAVFNYAHLLNIAKSQSVIIRENCGDGTTLLLTADSEKKTREKFRKLL